MLSIVIPTKNGAATLPALLDSLERQQVGLATELIVVDSGSTDGTVELVRNRVDRFITIPLGEFDHGLTRNQGIEASRGELVALFVQDAVPASERLLHELTAPLLSDERVAGTFARQVPRPDAHAIARACRNLAVTTAARILARPTLRHYAPLGYPFNRSKLRGWVTLVLARTIRSPWASSRPGSGPMRTA